MQGSSKFVINVNTVTNNNVIAVVFNNVHVNVGATTFKCILVPSVDVIGPASYITTVNT